MLGLMYIGAGALYVALMIFVVGKAWNLAKGGPLFRRLSFALTGFLLVYLPVFWNHLPVVLAHRTMCGNDAGFKVQITPSEWAEQNKDRFQLLQGVDLAKTSASRSMPSGFSRYEFFGGLIAREERHESVDRWGMKFSRGEDRLLDTRVGLVIASRVDYSVGPREDARVWLIRPSCFSEEDAPVFQERQYVQRLKEIIK